MRHLRYPLSLYLSPSFTIKLLRKFVSTFLQFLFSHPDPMPRQSECHSNIPLELLSRSAENSSLPDAMIISQFLYYFADQQLLKNFLFETHSASRTPHLAGFPANSLTTSQSHFLVVYPYLSNQIPKLLYPATSLTQPLACIICISD